MESIKHLNLTPAESYFLQDPEAKDGKTMMKYSLIHLIYKKMLSTEVAEEETGVFKKKMVEVTYVDCRGIYNERIKASRINHMFCDKFFS